MRAPPLVTLVLGALLALGGAGSGCVVGFYTLTLIEPPHPEWGFELGATGQTVEPSPALSATSYVVWLDTPEGAAPCALEIRRREGGAAIGKDSGGHHCSVHARAAAGDAWEIDARGAPGVRVYFAHDDALTLPAPLKIAFAGAGLAFALGLAGVVRGVRGLSDRRRPSGA